MCTRGIPCGLGASALNVRVRQTQRRRDRGDTQRMNYRNHSSAKGYPNLRPCEMAERLKRTDPARPRRWSAELTLEFPKRIERKALGRVRWRALLGVVISSSLTENAARKCAATLRCP